ncbi:MAG: hemolysin III family protein [Clostridia bacterium]|nr:hemolysin III family protein [Clostridia bacterium]
MTEIKDNNSTEILLTKRYTLKEEIANSISHGLGVVFSIVALTILLVYSISKSDVTATVAFSIYGASGIFLYLASTLYHSFRIEGVKRILRVFDHSSIYLYIAGCYTPIALLGMEGGWRIGIIVSVWLIAVGGITFKIITYKSMEKYKRYSLGIYLAMGWLAVATIKPLLENLPLSFLMYLLAGGLVYTIGTIFYAFKKIPFNHAIWHLFVLAGTVVHFLGIFKYLA